MGIRHIPSRLTASRGDMEFAPVLCDMDECLYRLEDTPENL